MDKLANYIKQVRQYDMTYDSDTNSIISIANSVIADLIRKDMTFMLDGGIAYFAPVLGNSEYVDIDAYSIYDIIDKPYKKESFQKCKNINDMCNFIYKHFGQSELDALFGDDNNIDLVLVEHLSRELIKDSELPNYAIRSNTCLCITENEILFFTYLKHDNILLKRSEVSNILRAERLKELLAP